MKVTYNKLVSQWNRIRAQSLRQSGTELYADNLKDTWAIWEFGQNSGKSTDTYLF